MAALGRVPVQLADHTRCERASLVCGHEPWSERAKGAHCSLRKFRCADALE